MVTQQQKYCNMLVIGDSCVDKFHYGTCDRISPEAPVSVFRHLRTEVKNGMCLNVKENLVSFAFAEITVLTNTEEITKERFIDADSGQHLLRTDFGENKKLRPFIATKNIEKEISGYDCVVISDYEKGFITEEVAEKIVRSCVKNNIPIFVDSKKRDLSCFRGAIIKINEKEFDMLDKSTVDLSKLIVTYGKHGARWKGVRYPSVVVEVSDVSGAGDTFLSALVYGYHRYDGDIGQSITLANQCAGLVVQKSGTYALSRQDVQDICN